MSVRHINTTEIKEKVDVVSLLKEYGFSQIEDNGEWINAICQFHDDTNPSFTIRKSDTKYHCWSCKVSGDALTLVMELDGVDFKSALSKLAIMTGYSLDSTEQNLLYLRKRWMNELKESRTNVVTLIDDERLLLLNNVAANYFRTELEKDLDAQAYLIHRGFVIPDVEDFHLGFCPYKGFAEYMQFMKFTYDELINSRLFGDYGYGLVPKFEGRLIFPIFGSVGKHVRGFSARAISEEQVPKYINSTNSEFYKKGHFLYGFEQATSKEPLILVEGNFDCIRMRIKGFNAVAQLGSALTPVQCKLLGQKCRTIVLLYDGDDAGKLMAFKNIPIMIENSLIPKVVFLPREEDPDTFVRYKGVKELTKLIDNSEDGLSYLVYCEGGCGGDDVSILSLCLKMISKAKDSVSKEYHTGVLSRLLPFSPEIIKAELKKV